MIGSIRTTLPWAHRTLAAGLALVLVTAGCAAGVGDAGPLSSPPPAPTGPSATGGSTASAASAAPSQSPIASTAPAGPSSASATLAPAHTELVIYLIEDGKLVPVQRQVRQTTAVARASMNALLAGPTAGESAGPARLSTLIPDGTQLLDIALADGIVTVDLTGTFESGGGSASMFGRLAQVVYTLTQFPSVKGVTFRLDGQPVTTFSGEGIVLDRPSARADYRDYVPAIFLDQPAWGSTLAGAARLVGVANVFEAQFAAEVSNASGAVLAQRNVTASCGTGCWGTFDVTIPFSVDHAQPGFVTVYDLSPRDGSKENVRSYPVTLAPAG